MANTHSPVTSLNRISLFGTRLASLELALKAWPIVAEHTNLRDSDSQAGLSAACYHLQRLVNDLYSPLDEDGRLDRPAVQRQLYAIEGVIFLVNQMIGLWAEPFVKDAPVVLNKSDVLALFSQVHRGVVRLKALTEQAIAQEEIA